eukprot:scaffold21331_cov117-Isochrysis_galbana.AAC.12
MRKTASVPADWSHSCSEAIIAIAPPRSVRGGGTGRQACNDGAPTAPAGAERGGYGRGQGLQASPR